MKHTSFGEVRIEASRASKIGKTAILQAMKEESLVRDMCFLCFLMGDQQETQNLPTRDEAHDCQLI